MARPPRLDWRGDAVSAEVKGAAAGGIAAALEQLKARSQAQVPIDEGRELHDSATTSVDTEALRGALSYGGGGTVAQAYAERQHEDMDYEHDAGRKAKFVEDPMNEGRKEAGETIAAAIRGVTGS